MQQQQQQLMQQQLQQIQQLQQQQQPQNSGAPKGLSATYLSCRKQARGGVDQERCIEREQTLQDDRLARVYDRLRYELDGSARARLMEAQYAWEQSNAQARDLDNSLYGGSQAESLQRAEAALWRICARADELEKYLGAAR
ncbi:lysozyme inhibitor LprI family protein [Xanthomonas sp. SI]|nr:lysozyme inhibitor LprI family protein [Xanthomonas sp. SI]